MNFFGISGGVVINLCYLWIILVVIDEYCFICFIVYMGGNDLDSWDNVIDIVVFGLIVFLI